MSSLVINNNPNVSSNNSNIDVTKKQDQLISFEVQGLGKESSSATLDPNRVSQISPSEATEESSPSPKDIENEDEISTVNFHGDEVAPEILSPSSPSLSENSPLSDSEMPSPGTTARTVTDSPSSVSADELDSPVFHTDEADDSESMSASSSRNDSPAPSISSESSPRAITESPSTSSLSSEDSEQYPRALDSPVILRIHNEPKKDVVAKNDEADVQEVETNKKHKKHHKKPHGHHHHHHHTHPLKQLHQLPHAVSDAMHENLTEAIMVQVNPVSMAHHIGPAHTPAEALMKTFMSIFTIYSLDRTYKARMKAEALANKKAVAAAN